MSREDDVGAAGVGEAAKDSRDELEDILKALEAGDSDKHGPNVKIIIGVIAGIVLASVTFCSLSNTIGSKFLGKNRLIKFG